MLLDNIPADVWMMKFTPALLQRMTPVTTGEMYEVGTNNLHSQGLFSVEIFGALGTEGRDVTYSYINLNTEILNPRIYNKLVALRAYYEDLMHGRKYGIWNPKERDFEQCDPDEVGAQTGYGFFMSHVMDIKHLRNDSGKRDQTIDVIDRYKPEMIQKEFLLIPAGMRDLVVEDGRTSEDDINGMYRSMISTANAISITSTSRNDPVLDAPRLSLQKKAVEIELYCKTIIGGKKGFAQAKWAARKIRNSSANVISPMVITTPRLGTKASPTTNDVQMGLYQAAVNILPMTMFFLRSGWLGKVFQTDGRSAIYLTNRRTLHKELVTPTTDDLALFTSREGYERVVHKLKRASQRNAPIVTRTGHYIGLLYYGVQGFKFFQDIDDLPDNFDRKNVYPINWMTLIYVAGYREWRDFPTANTRYPVAGMESTIIKAMMVRTTTTSEVVPELGDDWRRIGHDYVAESFPSQSREASFVETMSVHVIDEKHLAADHDGDRMNSTAGYSKESREEFRRKRYERESYVGPDGQLVKTASVDNVELTLKMITGVRNGH